MILPLAYRNVNISDLCLLEALKLFHPHGYNLIRQSGSYITDLDSGYQVVKNLLESEEKRQKEKDEFISKILANVDSDRLFYITEIVNKLLYPFISPSNISRINLLDKKSICSPVYFDRYFLYTPPDDIISDIEFDRLIEDITTMSQDELTERFEFYYQKYGYDKLKRVIDQILNRKYYNNISNDCIGLICVALSRLSVNKARQRYFDPEIRIHVEFTICDILNSYVANLDEKRRDGSIIRDYEKQVNIIKTIFSEQELLPFHLFLATHICENCNVYHVEEEKVNSLIYDLISRYIAQNAIGAMFKLEQTPTTELFKIWKEMDPAGYRDQVEQYINSDEFDAVPFIQKMIYNSDINYYNRFCELFNADMMYEKVKNVDHDQIYDFSHTIGYFIRMQEEKRMSLGESSMTPGGNSMTPGGNSMTPGGNSISPKGNIMLPGENTIP